MLIHLEPALDYGLDTDASSTFAASMLGHVAVGPLILAGGDTSIRRLLCLGFKALGLRISLGICVCVATHRDSRRKRMRKILKGQQMGSPDIFELIRLLPCPPS